MLESLCIRHFAIIDALTLEFDDGLSVLTGETGAGKSILLDALGLALGERADKAAIRQGADKAEVTAVFAVGKVPAAQAWLSEQELVDEDEPLACVVRRVVTDDGRSRAFINQRRVTVQDLRDFGELLVEIHGQHAHHALLAAETQRTLLDGYGDHTTLLGAVRTSFEAYHAEKDAYDTLAAQAAQRESRLEFLRFQTSELAELVDAARQHDDLDAERNRLAHSDRLRAGAETALDALYAADDSAQSQVATAARALAGLTELAPELASAEELLREADVCVSEAADVVRRFNDQLHAEPARLDELETTLAGLRHTARKHATSVTALPALYTALCDEMDALADFDASLARRQQTLDDAHGAYIGAASALSQARSDAAMRLGAAVTDTMHGLGLAAGTFRIAVEAATDRVSAHGIDRVRFEVATNPGQAPRALGKTASGGELARIGLAIAVNLADVSGTPTLIFDEVDAGIGGAVAEIVGRRLRELGQRCQVLCVTHLAQVASCGHHHFRVSKRTLDDTSQTDIAPLNDSERVREIARMLGGIEVTEATLRHAAEMLASGTDDDATRKRA